MLSIIGERRLEKQKMQADKIRSTKKQELKVLTDAISKVRDTDESEVKQQAENRYPYKKF